MMSILVKLKSKSKSLNSALNVIWNVNNLIKDSTLSKWLVVCFQIPRTNEHTAIEEYRIPDVLVIVVQGL